MRVGAILLLCLVLQLSYINCKKQHTKKKSKILHKAVQKHIQETHLDQEKKSKTIEHKVTSTTGEAHKRVIESKHYKTETKILKRSVKEKKETRDATISVKIVNPEKTKNKRSASQSSLKHELVHYNKNLHMSKRSNAPIYANQEIGVPTEIIADKLPGGYGEDPLNEEEDDDSGSGGESGDEESGSGSSDKEMASTDAKIGDQKSVDRDEDDVRQIVQNELKEAATKSNPQTSFAQSHYSAKPSKNSEEGKGSKRQPKGEWVCKKRCAAPMTFEECANPRCSYKIGTIKDLCYFLCKNQQPTCKEVCKYE